MPRVTKQKRMISEELEKFESFFSADELYEKVITRDPGMGKATVYRYLKELRETHDLHSYLCDRRLVYSKDLTSHGHFTCQECGRIIHFDVDSIDFLARKFNGTICHFLIDVSGVCDECSEEGTHDLSLLTRSSITDCLTGYPFHSG